MVGFRPSFSTDSHCLFRGIVKPSFKTTGSYSTVVSLSKISATFMVHSVIAKPELVDVVNILLNCCVTFSTILNLGLPLLFQRTKLALTHTTME